MTYDERLELAQLATILSRSCRYLRTLEDAGLRWNDWEERAKECDAMAERLREPAAPDPLGFSEVKLRMGEAQAAVGRAVPLSEAMRHIASRRTAIDTTASPPLNDGLAHACAQARAAALREVREKVQAYGDELTEGMYFDAIFAILDEVGQR